MAQENIQVVKRDGEVFYHVDGDVTKYFDLNNLTRNHPELQTYISQYKFDLQSRFFHEQDNLHQSNSGSTGKG